MKRGYEAIIAVASKFDEKSGPPGFSLHGWQIGILYYEIPLC